MINSALTRWLHQGLARGECPLCRVAHKAENEYLWYFFDEYSAQDAALDQLRAAHGFCARHGGGLHRIEVENLKSTLGISQTYEDTLTGVVENLGELERGGGLDHAACPACAYRDEKLAKHTEHFATMLAESEQTRERFASSPGLCMRHLPAMWELPLSGEVRRLVLDVERHNAIELRDQLTEHVRKQGAEARGEAPGPEADAWQRALWFTAGWPGDLDAR